MRLLFLQKGLQRALPPEDIRRSWQSATPRKTLTRTSEPDHVGALISDFQPPEQGERNVCHFSHLV